MVSMAGFEPAWGTPHAPEACASTVSPHRPVKMPEMGLEPIWISPYAPQAYVSTNSTTPTRGFLNNN